MGSAKVSSDEWTSGHGDWQFSSFSVMSPSKKNLGMGEMPARKFFTELRRRNEFDEWGMELVGGWNESATWVEVAYVRRGTPADCAGIRRGDRLISVNDTFTVFLPVLDVMETLNKDQKLVAWLEIERPTVREEYHAREMVVKHVSFHDSTRGSSVNDIISDRYSIRSPRHYNWQLLDPLPLAEKEAVHNLVRQDKIEDFCSKKYKNSAREECYNDFLTAKRTCNFVNKYYKHKDQSRAF